MDIGWQGSSFYCYGWLNLLHVGGSPTASYFLLTA